MDRQALLAAWAEAVADGRDQPQPLWDLPVTQQGGEEDERFAFERQRHADEVALRREQFEIERERIEMQRQEMMMKQEEIEQQREEMRMKQEEMDRQYQRENPITAKVKRWRDCLKNSLYAMPQDSIEIVNWFQNLEQYIGTTKFQIHLVDLMRPYLNYKAKTLLGRFQSTEIVDYEFVKRALLREFKLDAQSYLYKFNTITIQDGESYSSFAGRVRALLMYYIESRHVKTNNDQLLNLLVSDKIKPGLDGGTLCHILAVEAAISNGWLPPEKLVSALEAYRANYSSDGRPRSGAVGITSRMQNRPVPGPRPPMNGPSVMQVVIL